MTFNLGMRLPAVLVGAILLLHTALASAGEPTDQLRETIDQVIAVLKASGNNPDGRRDKLRELIYPRFDFEEMGRRALGAHWRKLNSEEQKEFIKLFTDLLEGAYLETVASYKGEKIRYLDERQDKNFAQVQTKIIDTQGKEYSVDYRLHSVDGSWKVYDLVIENISLVNNYRSQFNRILTKSSYKDLASAMKDKKISSPRG
jgi:phospholipid transport system substrate-binding protein